MENNDRFDLTGRTFGKLTAMKCIEGSRSRGAWECRCECGSETDIPLDKLKYSDVISCGCMREKCNQEIPDKLIHVAGTSIDVLRSSKIRSDKACARV